MKYVESEWVCIVACIWTIFFLKKFCAYVMFHTAYTYVYNTSTKFFVVILKGCDKTVTVN